MEDLLPTDMEQLILEIFNYNFPGFEKFTAPGSPKTGAWGLWGQHSALALVLHRPGSCSMQSVSEPVWPWAPWPPDPAPFPEGFSSVGGTECEWPLLSCLTVLRQRPPRAGKLSRQHLDAGVHRTLCEGLRCGQKVPQECRGQWATSEPEGFPYQEGSWTGIWHIVGT